MQAGPDVEDGVPYIWTEDIAGDELGVESLLRSLPPVACRALAHRRRFLVGEAFIIEVASPTLDTSLTWGRCLSHIGVTTGLSIHCSNEMW